MTTRLSRGEQDVLARAETPQLNMMAASLVSGSILPRYEDVVRTFIEEPNISVPTNMQSPVPQSRLLDEIVEQVLNEASNTNRGFSLRGGSFSPQDFNPQPVLPEEITEQDIDGDLNVEPINSSEPIENAVSEINPELHVEIPINSQIILVNEETSRFSNAVWYNAIQRVCVTLVGLGGIGSYVGFLLARMRPENIYIYDNDKVEVANMSGQLYSAEDVGSFKGKALNKMMRNYANYHQTGVLTELFTSESIATDIMICGFDNMEARITCFSVWLEHVTSLPVGERDRCLFIDGRLAAEEFQVFCITGDNTTAIRRYKKDYLFSDSEADATICSYKQTSFCANMIASYMVNIFVNFIANTCEPLIPRTVPFYTYYCAENMYLKIEE